MNRRVLGCIHNISSSFSRINSLLPQGRIQSLIKPAKLEPCAMIQSYSSKANINKLLETLKADVEQYKKDLQIPEVEDEIFNKYCQLRKKSYYSTYKYYLKKRMVSMIEQAPDMHHYSRVKSIAEEWNNLPYDQKMKYMKERIKAQEEIDTLHESKLSEFLAELEPGVQEELEIRYRDSKIIKRLKKAVIKIKKLEKENGKPLKPMPVFAIFHEENSKINNSDNKKSLNKSIKESSKKWQQLSDEEKKKYLDIYNERQKEYNKEIELWEMRMIEEGKGYIVNREMLEKTSMRIFREYMKNKKKDMTKYRLLTKTAKEITAKTTNVSKKSKEIESEIND